MKIDASDVRDQNSHKGPFRGLEGNKYGADVINIKKFFKCRSFELINNKMNNYCVNTTRTLLKNTQRILLNQSRTIIKDGAVPKPEGGIDYHGFTYYPRYAFFFS